MKRLITFIIAAFVLFNAASAQIRSIPSAVTNAFQQQFANATDVSWKDHVANFEAKFKMDGYDYVANYGKKGDLKRTEKTITFDRLPASVQTSFSNSKYSDWEKGSVAEIDDKKDGFSYRVFVQKNIVQKKFIYFSREGKMLKEGNI